MIYIDGLPLYGAQESQAELQTNVNVSSVPTMDGEDTLVTALEAQESAGISGRVTGLRLAEKSGYPSDPQWAIADWIQRFESLCKSEQGTGWTLEDNERGRSIQAIVTEASWTYSYEAPYEASWTLQARRGEGILTQEARSPTQHRPNSTALLDSQDLGSIDEFETTLQVDVETFPLAFGSTADTLITPASGMVREVTWSGQKTGSSSALQSFDDSMRSKLGPGSQSDLQLSFPGGTLSVIVSEYRSTFAAGDTSMRYMCSVVEGDNLIPDTA